MDIETISELVENDAVFTSNGYSEVKVTKNGKSKLLRLPIKSRGLTEYQRELNSGAPRPPVISKLIRAESDLGKEMGFSRDQACMVFDFTDETYIKAQEEHGDDYSWRLAIFALDIRWTKKDGTEAATYEEKKRILQSSGINGVHIRKIYSDILTLTQFTEKERDFLSES
ncbi:MAG: hypothetical protein ACU83N_10030 [Gammaproteobacteria bacterium]